jgi:exopolysaccharide production protein ExoZ
MTDITRLAYLDALRGIAILMVIVLHVAAPFRPAASVDWIWSLGAHGVQLFFLVSALTMCHMWALRERESGRTWKFYFRRSMRIAPLYWLALACYVVLGDSPASSDWAKIFLTVTFFNAFSPEAINDLVPGGWSISIEMLFYLLFPALVTVLASSGARQFAALAAFLLGVAGMALLSAVIGTGWPEDQWTQFLYFSLLTQLPVFLIGMAIYPIAITSQTVNLPYLLAVAGIWLALAAMAKALGLYGRPFFWLIVFALAAMTVITCRLRLNNQVLEAFGRRSYSMYLLHFPIVYGLSTPGLLEIDPQWLGGWPRYLAALLLTLVLTFTFASVTYRYVEATLSRWAAALLRSPRSSCQSGLSR